METIIGDCHDSQDSTHWSLTIGLLLVVVVVWGLPSSDPSNTPHWRERERERAAKLNSFPLVVFVPCLSA